jgi:hypothetical protein
MFVPVARACALTDIQRVRRLNLPGEVLVHEGQQVYPEDVVAEAVMPAKVVMVEIASSLGVDIIATKDLLVREPGEYLYEGDMIAQISGTLPRLVRSPVDGRFAGLHQGKAVFEVGHRTIQVQAGMMGVVQSVLPEYGAVLSTRGLLLQGVWGNGAVGMGDLRMIKASWSRPLGAAMLAEVGQGELIAAGSCDDAEVLAKLAAMGSAGLILGLLAPGLIQTARVLSIPIIAVQGFGLGQSDLSLLDLLKPHSGAPVSLNACEADHLTGGRPEAIISMDAEAGARVLGVREALQVGQRVRVFSEPAWGLTGEVSALPEGLTLFESGVQQPAAVIKLNNGEEMTVPRQNLVIIDAINPK